MANSYFSTVFEQSASQVWSAIRDFGEYQWAGTEYQARIDGGRPGDAVGSVRIIGDDGPANGFSPTRMSIARTPTSSSAQCRSRSATTSQQSALRRSSTVTEHSSSGRRPLTARPMSTTDGRSNSLRASPAGSSRYVPSSPDSNRLPVERCFRLPSGDVDEDVAPGALRKTMVWWLCMDVARRPPRMVSRSRS